ncbi:MAG TPA: hypothetical protein VEX15_10365 [Nocardioidaceae bacterium]|nr:hypothetical protein [Nocardioidaceae bacterium]
MTRAPYPPIAWNRRECEASHPTHDSIWGGNHVNVSIKSGDIDGDGQPDSVHLAEDPDAGPNCRTFVVVDTGDVTYSANLTVESLLGYHSGGSTLAQIVDLGGSSGDEIVVKQVATATEWMHFYPVYTLHAGKLQAVDGPANAYDPYGLRTGAGCSTDGRIVMSTASDLDPNVARTVTRRFYELVATTWHRVGRDTGEVPAGQPLAAAYPEFARPFFGGC